MQGLTACRSPSSPHAPSLSWRRSVVVLRTSGSAMCASSCVCPAMTSRCESPMSHTLPLGCRLLGLQMRGVGEQGVETGGPGCAGDTERRAGHPAHTWCVDAWRGRARLAWRRCVWLVCRLTRFRYPCCSSCAPSPILAGSPQGHPQYECPVSLPGSDVWVAT